MELSIGCTNKKNVDFGKPKNKSHKQWDIFINSILLKFGDDHDIKMVKGKTHHYHKNGVYSTLYDNSAIVQEHFKDFKKWVLKNYSIN